MDIGVGGLRWLGNLVEKRCLNRGLGRIALKQAPGDGDSDDEVQYNIIINPTFSEGTRGWFGEGCSLSVGSIADGSSCYAIAHGRHESSHGLAQEIGKRLEANAAYRVEAWVAIRSSGPAEQEAVVHASVKVVRASDAVEERIVLSSVGVKKGQWCLLSGTLQGSDQPRDATVYIDGPDGGIEILVSSVAIVPTTPAVRRDMTIENQVESNRQIVAGSLRDRVPRAPLRDGYFEVNIVQNSDFENGLDHWYPMGDCTLTINSGGPTTVGNAVKNSLFHSEEPILSGKYVCCSNRTEAFMGPCQDITDQVQLYQAYQVFAWVKTTLPFGTTELDVALDVDGVWVQGGEAQVAMEWMQIQGSFRLESKPKQVQVYIQGPIAGVDIMLAGLQIFAVDRLARAVKLQKQIEVLRKRDVIVKLRDSEGNGLPPGTKVSVQQTRNSFPMGSCINHDSLVDERYRSFFVDHFNYAVFENELKWDQVEPEEGDERYRNADEMVEFCNTNKIPMRGHCIVWDVNQQVPDWVQELDGMELLAAVEARVTELMLRYKGQFQHYDVNNEMLHGDFYEEKLGSDFLPYLFKVCNSLDSEPLLFVNEFDVENNYDSTSSPQRYADLVKFLRNDGAPVGGIGIQGHLNVPIGSILADSLDILSTLSLPIWFTEIDVSSKNEDCRAEDLEVIIREAFAHPSVHGCLLWGFLEGAMSREDGSLVNPDFSLTAAGTRLVELRKEWTTNFEGVLDSNGELVFRGYHGNYSFTVEGEVDGQRAFNTFEVVEGDGFLELEVDG